MGFFIWWHAACGTGISELAAIYEQNAQGSVPDGHPVARQRAVAARPASRRQQQEDDDRTERLANWLLVYLAAFLTSLAVDGSARVLTLAR